MSLVALETYAREVEAPDPLDRREGLRFTAHKWTLALLASVVGLTLYQVLGRIDLHRSPALLDTSLDRALPLLPWTTWFYEPFYVAIFLIAIVGFRSRLLFHRALICSVANMTVAALGHYLIRAEYPRPLLALPHPGLSTAFLAFVYRIDPPGNVFPSLHVAHAFTLAFILRLDRPRLGAMAVAMAVVLALSTLTTKQHFIADVLAGLAMALLARTWVMSRTPGLPGRASAPLPLPVPQR